MNNLNLRLIFALLAVVGFSACSSSSHSDAVSSIDAAASANIDSISTQNTVFNDAQNIGSSNALQSNAETTSTVEYLRVHHHLVECENYFVTHCLLVQKEGSDEWDFFYENIEGFDYKWGNEYEILLQVNTIDSGLPSGPQTQYALFDTLSETTQGSDVTFEYTSRKSDERIVEVAPDEFSLLGNKTFTCGDASCDVLRSAMDQNQSAVLSFQHAGNTAAPLVLVAVLCADADQSFKLSCL